MKRQALNLLCVALVAVAAGCRPEAGGPLADAADRYFDAGSIQPGDTVLGLRVVSVDVQRVFEDSVWSGSVLFHGEIEVSGVLQQHFDAEDADAPCLHVLDATSISRIPEFAPDTWTSPNARTWFCFVNPEQVRAAIGEWNPPRHVTVLVDSYVNHRMFSDVFDTARLLRVVAVGDRAGPTLQQ